MSDLTDLQKTLSLLNDKVKNNVKIVTPKDIGQDTLYHLTTRKSNKFIPAISKNAAPSEDNTLPRIHVSTHLIGCIQGYSIILSDILKTDIYFKEDREVPHGEYFIYTFKYDYALRPNKRLVYDADITNEHWLITYNEKTKYYTPIETNRIFVSSLIVEPNKIKGKDFHIMFNLSVENSLRVDDKTTLPKGYYQLEVVFNNNDLLFRLNGYREINKIEYQKDKELKTVLLNFTEKTKLSSW